ncbi:hypothetical protein PR202_ga08621 [Eleusine coracana subsp. coracana]|uniref:Uncharacterized protein n=1 Tax=Eleusine coracana subsp. coracana TaxID=191504 RepID=A0AAV5C1W2_ELECO|nr:hypothetical protein PR202_ga08621 [Eleusine coracana subsp. coracana]
MKISMTSKPKGHPWLVFTMFLATFVMLGEGATSFSPPSLSLSPTYAPVVKVIGKVYCYRCFNETHPEESHAKVHLEGAMVKVTCQANDEALVGFGYTKNNGKYSVILKGLPISNNYGADSCKVELHAAPGGSECNVPIELNMSGLNIYSKSNDEVVLKANQMMAYASKKSSGCSKPHAVPSMHPYNSPPVPYHYPSPPFSYKSPPLPYQYSPPPSNQVSTSAYQFPSPPQSYYPSPPPYHQLTPPNSYPSPPQSYNYAPPPPGLKSPTPTQKFLPPPYYYNTPPPQHHYSPPPNNYLSPPLAYQYPPPPYKAPVLPSSPVTPHHSNSPPPYQYAPPPYNYQSLPPPAQYPPPLPPTVPNHVHPEVPHKKSPPASSVSLQPLYQYTSPPPANEDMSSATAPLNSYQFPSPPNQLS